MSNLHRLHVELKFPSKILLHFLINQADVTVGDPWSGKRNKKKETIDATSPFSYIACCRFVDFQTFAKQLNWSW